MSLVTWSCRSLLTVVLCVAVAPAVRADGELDETFAGSNGMAVNGQPTNAVRRVFLSGGGTLADTPHAIRLDSDGNIMLSGVASTGSGTKMVLARLGPNGSGAVDFWTFPVDGQSSGGTALSISPVGPCAVGYVVGAFAAFPPYVACPQTQAAAGAQITAPTDILGWVAATDARADNGNYVFEAVGTTLDSPSMLAIGRFVRTPGGGLAAALGYGLAGDGVHRIKAGSDSLIAAAVAPSADGGLFVAGEIKNGASSNSAFAVLKVSSAGMLDPSFDGNGVVYPDLNHATRERATAIAQDASGRVVVAGNVETSPTDHDVGIACFEPDGAYGGCAAFWSTTYRRFLPDTPTVDEDVAAIAIDRQGRIYLVGTVYLPKPTLVVMRLTADGGRDPSFGEQGTALFDFDDAAGARGVGIALQDGQPIILGEYAHPSGTNTDFVVFRLRSNLFVDGFEEP